MKLHFVKVNPVQNMTIFILDQVPRKEQIHIANKLMAYENLYAEQVGFIEQSINHSSSDKRHIRLQMMGGEFCGNAARSLAAFMVHNGYPQIIKKENKYIVPLEVSGMDKIINCEVEPLKDNKFLSKIKMPNPLSIDKVKFVLNEENVEALRVNFPGISHFIVDKNLIKDEMSFYNIIKDEMDSEEVEAFGIMFYDFKEKFMTPLVYVKATDSLFWEKSCASGTCALGSALAYLNNGSIEEKIKQPGGDLDITIDWNGEKITSIYLNGMVEIVAEGIVYI